MLCNVLTRAVPDVRVESVRVGGRDGHFFIYVEPYHAIYWMRFKEEYPHSIQLARAHGATSTHFACPEFPTRKNLIEWLCDVLDLPLGVRNLALLFMEGLLI